MDFPRRLESILLPSDDEDSHTNHGQQQTQEDATKEVITTTINNNSNNNIDVDNILRHLQQWNEEIELFLSIPTETSVLTRIVDDQTESSLPSTLSVVASNLHRRMILSWCSTSTSSKVATNSYDEDNDNNEDYMDSIIKEQQQPQSILIEYIRAGKNLLRWSIQIYSERQRRQHGNDIFGGGHQSPVHKLKCPQILTLVYTAMQSVVSTVVSSSTMAPADATTSCRNNKKYNDAKHCSLYLFYATYSVVPNDKLTQKGMDYLTQQLSFPKAAMEILCQIDSIPFALSLIRNVHNVVVSIPGATNRILSAQVSKPNDGAVIAPWLTIPTEDNQSSALGFVSICTSLVGYCLLLIDDNITEQEDTGIVYELMNEIMNAFYALRISPLNQVGTAITTKTGGPVLADIVLRMLPLSSATNDDKINNWIRQCKLATVSLLMESDPSFSRYLLEAGSVPYLFEILSQQVNDVVDNTRVDYSATAALVPILTVLNKYSMASSQVSQQLKNYIFPQELEEQFQDQVKALPNHHESTNNYSTQNKNWNMRPLDAPKDTLRGKLVILLSWAESYIKRCTAELLWTICNLNATEYVHRVGLGNALPLLNAKGFASLPNSS